MRRADTALSMTAERSTVLLSVLAVRRRGEASRRGAERDSGAVLRDGRQDEARRHGTQQDSRGKWGSALGISGSSTRQDESTRRREVERSGAQFLARHQRFVDVMRRADAELSAIAERGAALGISGSSTMRDEQTGSREAERSGVLRSTSAVRR
jgi:uncharacterized protein GlcG (DUF336 family)